jgi:transcriptional regulator with XRE-family HTH domain
MGVKYTQNSINFTQNRNIFLMNSDSIGKIIHERRVYLNLTQKDVAEMAGTTFKSISEIELGLRNPTLNTLNRILDVLGLAFTVHIKTMIQ